ncbi:MAG: GyrI-like domain-containing protein [Anaerolineales bacterium]|nr:GyrI-like domain-containing protein [Anaerolineales bacterium]
MSDMNVRVVKLPAMRVACVNGFGEGPEGMAFDKMKIWAEAHDLLRKPYRLFGYNNPDPSPGSPNYGYDVWITVDGSVQENGDARIIEFPGGLYAVTRIEVKEPGDDIPRTWQELVKWMEASKYRHGRHQWLEEHIGSLGAMGGDQPFTLDLHLPIME